MKLLSRIIPLCLAGALSHLHLPAEGPSDSSKSTTIQNNSKSPNFILILCDDMGWSDTTVRMDPDRKDSASSYSETPQLHRFSERSMRFSDAYAPAPLCTPSRRSIQYGMTPARQRGTEFFSDFIPQNYSSIPQSLKIVDPRYQSAHFGKWGEVMCGKSWSEKLPEATPTAWGYDQSDGVTGNRTGTYHHLRIDGEAAYKSNWILQESADPKLTFSVTASALQFMETQASTDTPFYLQVSYYAIHTAYLARETTLQKYNSKDASKSSHSAGTAAMLEDLDFAIGIILDKIDELEIGDNTYVIITSDNGGESFEEKLDAPSGKPARNAPLKEGKQWIYEGGIRVPLMVRGPGVEPNSLSRTPVSLCDLHPTILELAGNTAAIPPEVDGGSLSPILKNKGKGSVTRHTPGLIFHRPQFSTPLSAIRQGRYKLLIHWDSGQTELYDLKADAGEQANLAPQFPEKAQDMERALRHYLAQVNAELPDHLESFIK
ncbi:sulfatase [Coraliomargarita sp. W4R72]